MNVLLVSQCNKRALGETRRILDQFAERKGDRTWQTAITLEGLKTLRKLLRKSARRNTAVACHWIRGANHTELLWIVGNLRRFNEQGVVPTNVTSRDILRSQDEDSWHSAHIMAVLAGIAGLFHDVGKANVLFQRKLDGKGRSYEPYRHEWVSLRLFAAFVGSQNDQAWLQAFAAVGAGDDARIIETVIDTPPLDSPFEQLPPLAKMIGWLIVSHHRLPQYPGGRNPPHWDEMAQWLEQSLSANWNSPRCQDADWDQPTLDNNWQFSAGSPLKSRTWSKKATELSKRALQLLGGIEERGNWLTQRFTMHLARLCLMLADHTYSASAPTLYWQDREYQAFANTDRITGKKKQKLDEHNIGVAHNAYRLALGLPKLRQSLPSITRHRAFKKRSQNVRFRWQDKAFDLACASRSVTEQQGFFGVNMASTGCGKTFANARIMYGLADPKNGCRFSVALGLRTLTLQTGDALRERLHLDDDDLAVLIGSEAVKRLHESGRDESTAGLEDEDSTLQGMLERTGSASVEDFAEHLYVKYDGSLDDGHLSKWLKSSGNLHRLVSAPVLVCTIDHLIPATEGTRGGKQIAPMLRLLSSDLVLDEPDDFGLDDLPAVCRLVNWAGVLGARVLVSSATLPPSLLAAMFDAYQQGRADFNQVRGEAGNRHGVVCAWFDEFGVDSGTHPDRKAFVNAHRHFIVQREDNLQKRQLRLRKGKLAPLAGSNLPFSEAVPVAADAIHQQINSLHNAHHQVHASGKRVSIGVIRLANINPLVAIAIDLLGREPGVGYRRHYCIYHSRHPMLVRSFIERKLDAALMRNVNNPDALWEQPEINTALAQYPEQNQVFIVLASPVAEVGRDHDYDWGIAEPSSMRSLIQLAGRIQRHRQQEPQAPNMVVLSKNIKALQGEVPAYCRPGFETQELALSVHDLAEIVDPANIAMIDAASRFMEPPYLELESSYRTNWVALEHKALRGKLFKSGGKRERSGRLHQQQVKVAESWWRSEPTLFGEVQRCQRFRKSQPQESYYLSVDEDNGDTRFYKQDPTKPGRFLSDDSIVPLEDGKLTVADGNQAWFVMDYESIFLAYAESLQCSFEQVSRDFGEILLNEAPLDWRYQPLLGIFRRLD